MEVRNITTHGTFRPENIHSINATNSILTVHLAVDLLLLRYGKLFGQFLHLRKVRSRSETIPGATRLHHE
jgi:hypothetical protein